MDQEKMEQLRVRVWILGFKVAVNEILKGLFENRISMSKWILGGDIAFIFWAIIQPADMGKSYNLYVWKFSVSCFLISFLCGARMVWGETVGVHFRKSPLAKELCMEMYKEGLAKGNYRNVDEIQDNKELTEHFVKEVFQHAGFYLKASKYLFYQLFWFLFGFIPLLARFYHFHRL